MLCNILVRLRVLRASRLVTKAISHGNPSPSIEGENIVKRRMKDVKTIMLFSKRNKINS